jgi:sigma-B regulation protein RsbU (phosphoserine phosphatase)
MIEPKIFYRELDAILSQIGQQETNENFFCTILSAVQKKFEKDLRIANSHVYEKRGKRFVRIDSSHREKEAGIPFKFSSEVSFSRIAIKKGSSIFPAVELDDKFRQRMYSKVDALAMIYIHTPVRKWMFVFELKSGWSQEEVLLFLNAMRTALNYRLFSEMMRSDLKQAEQIQKSLLPKVSPTVPGYQIHGYSQAAELVGGDFYDYFQLDQDDIGVSLGDASGHGVPAALLVRDVVIGLRMGLAKEMRLVHTVKKLNQVIQQSTYSTSFVSIFVGEIEKDGHLFYVNAGHPPPFLVSGKTILDLDATGITLGFVEDIDLKRGYAHMDSGSILVLYSDGIVEREKNEDEQFEISRLKDLVIENQNKSAEAIVKQVFKTVYDFGKQKPWEDDATLVVIKKL